MPTDQSGQQATAPGQGQQPWEYSLRKYLLLLATLVVTVTYGNTPGGVWQVTHDGQLAGDPIIRQTNYHRYLAFFYCNATAFAASLVVIVLILILAIRHDKDKDKGKKDAVRVVLPLRGFMVLDLLSLLGAYGAGTCRDKISIIYSAVLVAIVFVCIMLRWRDAPQEAQSRRTALQGPDAPGDVRGDVAGLSTPGGFWDSTGTTYRPGDAILKDHHSLRLTVFLLCNTTAFLASLLITMLLIIDGKKLREKTARSRVLYGCIVVALVSLVGAYTAGSCRKTDTTAKLVGLVGAVLAMAYILLYGGFYTPAPKISCSCFSPAKRPDDDVSAKELLEKARSLVLLLATLAATITYTAGLDPPGGFWQDNGDGHIAGDPILLTTNARRYKAFFYCNSIAFVASLVAIVLVQWQLHFPYGFHRCHHDAATALAAKREGQRLGEMVAEGDELDDPTGFGHPPSGLCSRLQQGVEDVCVCRHAHTCRSGLLCNPYDAVNMV
uniref:PGG domain-containing protein n=1 Tax=Aegilops tauschii TaxID=37682 RepID=M8APW3_AEGTA